MRGFPVRRIFTSPIPRCVQTAEIISEGFESKLEIISSKCLGDPGLHVNDEIVAGEFYLKYGFDEMYKRFINDQSIPGVPNSETFSALMTDFINSNTMESGLTIFVTHDSLIAFYDYCLRKHIYTKNNWVKYLAGIILKNES